MTRPGMIKIVMMQLFSMYFFIACNDNRLDKSTIAVVRDTSNTTLQALVKEIAEYEIVDEEHVGIAGSTSEQYKRFKDLSQQASDVELVALTNNINPAVRAYCFWALAKRNYPGLKDILENKKTDTALIIHFSGCTKMEYPIKEFYSSVMNRK